jgi:hypothetical protein
MLAVGGGGGSAKAAPVLPPKKEDERGELDIEQNDYPMVEEPASPDGDVPGATQPGLNVPGGRPGGNGQQVSPGALQAGPGGGTSRDALAVARQAQARQAQGVVDVRRAAVERGNAISNVVATRQQGNAAIQQTHGQLVNSVQQARDAEAARQRANVVAENALRGQALAEQAARQQTQLAADAAAASLRAQAEGKAAQAQALAESAKAHKAAADAATQAADQKKAQEVAARNTATQAAQIAQQKIAAARELAEREKQQAAAAKAASARAEADAKNKARLVQEAAQKAAQDRKLKEAALIEAEKKRKREAAATIAQAQKDLAEQKRRTAAAEAANKAAQAASAKAKTAAEKAQREAERKRAAAQVVAERKKLADEKAAGLLAIKAEKTKQDTLKREFIKQAFLNAVERCVAFNPKAPRQNCVNSVAKLFAKQGIPLGTKLGNFETKSVEEVQKAVAPIPLMIVPPQAKKPGPQQGSRPAPKPVTVKPQAGPTASQLDVNPVNYALYNRAIAAISTYLENSIKKHPVIKTNLARKKITTTAQFMSAAFLPKVLQGINLAENVLVPSGPGGAMQKRFYQRSENDRVMIALVQPPEDFKRRVLNGLIMAEQAVDSFGNPDYQKKWFVNGKSVPGRGQQVSFLYKQFNAPAPEQLVSGMGGWLQLGGWNS